MNKYQFSTTGGVTQTTEYHYKTFCLSSILKSLSYMELQQISLHMFRASSRSSTWACQEHLLSWFCYISKYSKGLFVHETCLD